jgi:hypothetical protein
MRITIATDIYIYAQIWLVAQVLHFVEAEEFIGRCFADLRRNGGKGERGGNVSALL